MKSDLIIRVLRQYEIRQPDCVTPISTGRGFSGANLWKIEVGSDLYCLKQWTQGMPKAKTRDLITTVLPQISSRGLDLACPIESVEGGLLIRIDGRIWDLSRWINGSPVVDTAVSENQLQSAMEWLASYHNLAGEVCSSQGFSPSLEYRMELTGKLHENTLVKLANYPYEGIDPELVQLFLGFASKQLGNFSVALKMAASQLYPLLPVVADLWSDHVFFVQDRVSGVIDFGAMKMDTPCLDLARLLGCYQTHLDSAISKGLEYYQALRPVSAAQRQLIELYDHAYVILAGVQWLIWLGPEKRVFSDMSRVNNRLKRIARRISESNS